MKKSKLPSTTLNPDRTTPLTPAELRHPAPHTRRGPRFVPRLALAAFIGALLSGCTVLSYSSPSGERFSRATLGSTTTLGALAVECGTNGIRRVELQGYSNESTRALGAVTEAAVRAALQRP